MKMLDIEQEQAYKRSCFSRNLKKAIGKQDKKALCKEIGIQYNSLLDWLSGKRYPSQPSIDKILDYFGADKFIESTPKWYMSDSEIIHSYNQSVDKKQQIRILADLNDLPVKFVKQKLKELNVLK